jgi:hypothetical protein
LPTKKKLAFDSIGSKFKVKLFLHVLFKTWAAVFYQMIRGEAEYLQVWQNTHCECFKLLQKRSI